MSAEPRRCPACGGLGPFYSDPKTRKCRACKIAQVVRSERAHPAAKRVRRQAAKAGIRARAMGERATIAAPEWRATLEAFGGCCAYCERPESEAGPLALDHVYPLARGGPNDASNAVPACVRCNSAKAAMLPLTYFFCLDLPI